MIVCYGKSRVHHDIVEKSIVNRPKPQSSNHPFLWIFGRSPKSSLLSLIPNGETGAMAPWPDQLCPHPDCQQRIRDLLAEMVPNADQTTPEFLAVVGQKPGGRAYLSLLPGRGGV
jgi:hypothetical protein